MIEARNLLEQLRAELLHDIEKYDKEAYNIKNEIPRTFTLGMSAQAKEMVRRIELELKLIKNNG
jgi:hypothetical protein